VSKSGGLNVDRGASSAKDRRPRLEFSPPDYQPGDSGGQCWSAFCQRPRSEVASVTALSYSFVTAGVPADTDIITTQ
jgi:hypothetical protein